MWCASRVLATLGVAGIVTLSRREVAAAQLAGSRSGAVSFAPTDQVALGDSSHKSLGLAIGSAIYSLGGGTGIGKGALRAYLGTLPIGYGARWLAALGYAQTLATRTLIGPVRASLGAQATAGFRYEGVDAGAFGLTTPLGATLGAPSSASLGFYLAPYVETNLMRRWVASYCPQGCRHYLAGASLSGAAGTGFGVRLSASRISLSAMAPDMLDKGSRLRRPGDDLSIGLTIRLGR